MRPLLVNRPKMLPSDLEVPSPHVGRSVRSEADYQEAVSEPPDVQRVAVERFEEVGG